MKEYVIARLKESSTWRGLIMLLTAAGVALNAAQMEAVVSIGMAIAGAIGVFLPDNKAA